MARTLKVASGGEADSELRARVNPEVWFTVFTARTLLECIIELLKNAFDWRSQSINIITKENRTQLRFVDDGRGMNARNREAFISVGESTAGGEQSGTFGTGAKKMVFTFASHVQVVTAPEDEADTVYVFEFTPQELALAYSNQGTIRQKRLAKTKKSWPHQHAFGTDITFSLKEPGSRSVFRGETLARKLADRLDLVLIEFGAVLVDDQRLPDKSVIGQVFKSREPAGAHPALGEVRFEFYRPAHKSPDEDLRLTDRSIGEVSFRDVFVKQLLSDDQRDLVPPLFLEPEVCGLITAGFFHDYVTEDRTRYDISIADDERVVELLRMLRQAETDVANRLGIKLRQVVDEDGKGLEEVDEVIERLNRKYNPGREVPYGFVTLDEDGEGQADGPKVVGGPQPTPPATVPRVSIERSQFALGEIIEAKLVVPGRKYDGWHFYLDQAHAEVIEEDGQVVRLKADKLGRGLIQAANPSDGSSAKAEYEVVTERVLHLSATYIAVKVGSQTTVRAINTDKLEGQLVWELSEGSGELKERNRGTMASFTPSRAGKAQIVAYDSARPAARLTCEVVVLPGGNIEAPFRIRDEYFKKESTSTNLEAYGKPATIVTAGPGEVHRMVINLSAPAYEAAYRAGVLQEVLLFWMASEYIRVFETTDEGYGDDIQGTMLAASNKTAQLLSEMLSS